MCIRTVFCTVFAVLLFFGIKPAAFSSEDVYSDVTTNQKLLNTLHVLKTHDDISRRVLNVIAGDNLSRKPIKIMFYDLSRMGYDFAKMDAVACKRRNSDRIYILINSVHKNAPVEALASLLSHETIHQDDDSSIKEEITGWTNEATSWISYNGTNSSLKNNKCALVKRLNTLAGMYISAGNTTEKISEAIYSNIGYASLPQHSDGFGM